jgi:hypothetical protein
MLKALFWLVVLVDALALGLMFVLGLAAAGPSKTSPLSVLIFFAVPALLLLGAIVVFVKAQSGGLRALAFLLAASPLLFVAVQAAQSAWEVTAYKNANGNLNYFRGGDAQALEQAIQRNDAVAVQALISKGANVNELGRENTTLLQAALQQLRKTPGEWEVLRALMAAGADPNAGSGELPLTMAIQLSGKAGPEPVKLLLDAKANPNALTEFGEPVWFQAVGVTVPGEVLTMLLQRGADVQASGRDGKHNALGAAAAAQNWKAVLMLLQKGADPNKVRTPMGQGLLEKLESDLRSYGDRGGDNGGLAEAIAYLKSTPSR